MNAMCVPSGDGIGLKSPMSFPRGASVNFRVCGPSAAISQIPRGPSRESAPPKASHCPSGIQERLANARGPPFTGYTVAILRSAPPSAGITIRSAALSEIERKNAIRAPPGAQAGVPSCAGFVVTRQGSPAPTSLM